MAAWRRRALALLPGLRGEINPARRCRFNRYNYYEHVFDVSHRDWPVVARWLSPSDIRTCWTLWKARHEKDTCRTFIYGGNC